MNILEVSVDSGKYTVVQDDKGVLSALRNGEPWRDLVGDKLVLCLAYELDQARKERNAAQSELAVAIEDRNSRERELKEAQAAAAVMRDWRRFITKVLFWEGANAVEKALSTTAGTFLELVKQDTDLLRQCLHTGALRTDRTRELYLRVCERVGEKP